MPSPRAALGTHPVVAPLPEKGARVPFVDALRGVAILGVVAIHGLALVPGNVDGWRFARWLDHDLRFAVPWFFGVLGFFTLRSYGARPLLVGPFLKGKGLTLAWPFLVFALLYAHNPTPFGEGRPELPLPLRILLGYTAPHLYFMVAYLGFIALTPAALWGLARLKGRSRKGSALLGITLGHLALLIGVELGAGAGGPEGIYLATDSRLPLHWLSSWGVGALMGLYLGQIQRLWAGLGRGRIPLIFALALAHGGIALWGIEPSGSLAFQQSARMVPLGLTGLGIFAGVWPWLAGGRLARVLGALGRRSLPIYLAHMLTLEATGLLLWGRVDPFTLAALGTFAGWVGGAAYIPLHARIFGGDPGSAQPRRATMRESINS